MIFQRLLASAYRGRWLLLYRGFGAPPTGARREISIITHRQQFVKRKVAQISRNYKSRFCAIYHLAFYGLSAIISSVKGRKWPDPLSDAELAPPVGNTLEGQKNQEFWKKFLTNTLTCGIIQVQGARKTRVAYEWCGAPHWVHTMEHLINQSEAKIIFQNPLTTE